MRSLRRTFVIASVLWTMGLLYIAHTVSIGFIHRYPILRMRTSSHAFFALLFGGLLMVYGFSRVRGGLSLFDRLRERLNAVRDGHAVRVDGTYPAEVQPLVSDLNALLEHRERMVRHALAKAGDLAHGLKTPLAVLAQELPDHPQLERMRRQIEYHLAHARAAASGATPGARSSVLESAEGLARTLLRLRGLTIDVHVDPAHTFRGEREDLDEMLGNLLDNACKWARSRVEVHSSIGDGRVAITVDDDGPGIAAELREHVLERGARADEAAPGSGLGLAIVRDLAELYGGAIALSASPLGGLRAWLELPS